MRLYTIERVFFDSRGEIARSVDYQLEPMSHEEAVTMLSKMYDKWKYDHYKCMDRIKEVY